MGLDGFSMGNLGLNTELTPTQLASQVEFSTQKEAEIKIRDPEQSAEDAAVKEKQEQEKQRQQEFNDGFKQNSESEEDSPEENEEQEKQRQQEFESKDVKEFSIKLNPQTETVEIYNRETGRTLETMNAKDLSHLVSKLDTASGVLINRKI